MMMVVICSTVVHSSDAVQVCTVQMQYSCAQIRRSAVVHSSDVVHLCTVQIAGPTPVILTDAVFLGLSGPVSEQ
jgi:hypothetical protein